jgi:hypothetical protein
MKPIRFNLVLMLLVFFITISSCKKEDTPQKNEVSYNGKILAIKKGFHENHGGPYQSIYLPTDDITFNNENYNYSASSNGLTINLYTAIGAELSGTYETTEEFEKPNSLRSVEIIIDGVEIQFIESDTGKVIINGDEITVTCTINGKELKAYFKGTLTYADLFHPGKKK